MSYTFEQVQLRGVDDKFPTEWMLKITTIGQLFEYYLATRPTIIQLAMKDFLDTKAGRCHHTNQHASAADQLAKESDRLVFPGSTIKILQWPKGIHWYAKIGHVDIVVDGEQKWNTREQAEKAAQEYLAGTESACGST